MTTYNSVIKKRNDTNDGWDSILPITVAENVLIDADGHSVATHLAEMATVERYGAKGDGITDDTAAIKAAIAAGDVIHFANKNYKVTDEIKLWHDQTIFAPKGLVLDGTDFVGTSGDSVLKVTNTGDAYTALPALTADIALRANTLTFASAHGLAVGDIICLYDNTPYSWSSFRDAYKKSEFCKVSSIISATEVLLDNEVFDSYDATTNANFGVYKMNMGTFNVIGSLKAIQGKQGAYYAMKFDRLKDFIQDNLVGIAKNGSYTGISLNQCYNSHIKAVAEQEKLSGLGGDYGLMISNCQHVIAEGYFNASRHGVSTGGYDGVGAIICRDIKVKGTMKTNKLGSVPAVGCHGNIEDAVFEGQIHGGIGIAGKNTKVNATIYADKFGVCVAMTEVRSFNHDLSGCKLISYGDPVTEASNRGVIDFGGNNMAESDYMESGVLDLRNINMYAPNAGFGIVIRTRNTNVLADLEKTIRLDGARIKTSTIAGSQAYRILDTSAAKNFKLISAVGVEYNAENRTAGNSDLVHLEKLKGNVDVATVTTSKSVDIAVTFSKPYPAGYTPNVTLSGAISLVGTVDVLYKVVAVSNTGFTARLLTRDGTNFSAVVSAKLYWVAQ